MAAKQYLSFLRLDSGQQLLIMLSVVSNDVWQTCSGRLKCWQRLRNYLSVNGFIYFTHCEYAYNKSFQMKTRRAWQSQTWGRPAQQVRVQNQFKPYVVEIPLAAMAVCLERSGDWLAHWSLRRAAPPANHRCSVVHCRERNFNYWNWYCTRNCDTGRSHVGLCPALLHCESKKTCHQTFVYIFIKYWPILKILSLAHSLANLQ